MTPPPSLPFLSGGIKAEWFDSESSAKYTAAFRIDEFGFAEAASEKGSRRESLSQIKVSPRLGDIPRRIIFSDGVCIVAADNDYIDRALAPHSQKQRRGGGYYLQIGKQCAMDSADACRGRCRRIFSFSIRRAVSRRCPCLSPARFHRN